MIPIMEAFAAPGRAMIVVVTGAQMAKTETVFNILGRSYHWGPRVPALYIGPTQKLVKSVSQDRIGKMIKSTPALYGMLEKGQKDSIFEKWLGGVRLGFAWAGSATELASHPAGLVLVDERDRMESDVGDEGDPVTLAKARTKNYPWSKTGVFSTPTVEGQSPTWELFDSGTCEMWAWPCVHCGELFVPKIKYLLWPDKATPAEAKASAHVACPHCGGVLETQHRAQMNAGGKFIAHEKREGEYKAIETPVNPPVRSFWVSGLASPWMTFGEIAFEFVAAYRSLNPSTIQAVTNTMGGELFKLRGDAPPMEEVRALALPYPRGSAPADVQLITAGVDVQKDGLYVVIRGWAPEMKSYLIEADYLQGPTELDTVYLRLQRMLLKHYSGKYVERCFVDSGYKPGDVYKRPEHQVYLFARRLHGLVFPTKGRDTLDRPIKSTFVDVADGAQVIKNGVQLWHLNTDYLKRFHYGLIRRPEDHPGRWHVYSEVDDDYCRQVVSEEMVEKTTGRFQWVAQGPNHYLDCEVGALGAALSLQVGSLTEEVETDEAPAQQPQSNPSSLLGSMREQMKGRSFFDVRR